MNLLNNFIETTSHSKDEVEAALADLYSRLIDPKNRRSFEALLVGTSRKNTDHSRVLVM